MWHNQVFLNRRLGKHWEAEFSIGFNQLACNQTYRDSQEPTAVFFSDWETRYLKFSLNMKYYFLQKRKWETFGLAGLGSTKIWSEAHSSYTGTLRPNSMYAHMPSEYKEETRWLGLSNINMGAGVNYNLTSRLQLSGLFQVSYKASGNTFYGSTVNQNDFSPALLAGIGYRF